MPTVTQPPLGAASGFTGISVLTAVLNAAATLGRLADDLLAQSDPDFRWIVVDGGSQDGSFEQLQALQQGALGARLLLLGGPGSGGDAGLYDALNKALARCTSSHYLVVGADDRLDPGAIAGLRELAADGQADIVAAAVRDRASPGGVATPGKGRPWQRGQHAWISHHSVGTLFRCALHQRTGPYSRQFAIAADHLFVKTAMAQGARLRLAPGFVVGEFVRGGVSTRRYVASQFELAQVQLLTERHRGRQLLLLVWRLLRHWRRFTAAP